MIDFPTAQTPAKIYTVSQLNREVRLLLDDEFSNLRVEGEISNLSTPSSGHIYFSLKDAQAQVRCAMFRTRLNKVNCQLSNGLKVIVRAQASLYEPRGDYQLIVNELEEAGLGVLRRNFELLKTKLAAEGLFANTHKKPLPDLPNCLGIITSPGGAAIHDILSVLKRRFPTIPIIIYPTSVQGESAKFEIVKAIQSANQQALCDVLILSRGGGSLEDLWAFNEELVARAIYESLIPIISGVGHEIDFTIADFVADARAPTPSAAAELAVPEQRQWLQRFQQAEARLFQRLTQRLKELRQQLIRQEQRLQQLHPGRRLQRNAQSLDQLETRLHLAIKTILQNRGNHLKTQTARIGQHNPAEKIRRYLQQQQFLKNRLETLINQRITHYRQRLKSYSQTLHAVSPLATLERGYAIVHKLDSNTIINQAQQLTPGELIQTRFAQGKIISQVRDIQS